MSRERTALGQMKRGRTIAIVLAGIAGLAFYYAYNPADTVFAPKCLFKLLTGWSCPGCGMQRFLHAMMHGRVLEAFSYNYLLVFLLPYCLLFGYERLLATGNTQRRLRAVIEGKALATFCCIAAPGWAIIRNLLHI